MEWANHFKKKILDIENLFLYNDAAKQKGRKMPRKTTKKTVKPVAKRNVVVPAADAHECHCGGACACGCHHGKFKKFIVLLIVFLLGFAVAKLTCCHGRHGMPKMHPRFENGCLVMDSVKCPKMQEALVNADADMNGCITRAEFGAVRRAMHKDMRHGPRRPMEK